ncbi:MAG: DUF362 domain-containing protein [Coriobacteriales bacterium]|nr:DUF362 domain-containing protein [Coriobacteriales bacterium]
MKEESMAQVYFTTMRVASDDSVPAKLRRLLAAAGLEGMDLSGKYVAIKTHFGEQGNVSFLRPAYTRTIAQEVRRLSGKPFVTDCSTLYIGMRNDLIDHLECARLNGFNHDSCGCEVVIADGLRGDDEVVVPVPDGTYVQEARIGRTVLDADVLVSLTHAKGCASAAFGGTLKNLGMGCGSRAGKMVMHSKGMPSVIAEKCTGCRKCLKSCAHAAIDIAGHKALINGNCVGCGHCISYCPQKAVNPAWNRNWEDMHMKIAEYAAAVVRNTQSLHVAVAIDVTPQCDCFAGNDSPVVPNVGMFASSDPVALDQAVADAINAQPVIAGSALSEKYAAAPSDGEGTDHLHAINPSSDWVVSLVHAEELGIGTRSYDLVTVG